ncbi:hypothetical protein LC082_08590 [Microbacterium esteraromaticum]|uniref:hypothetical protein n=1 Tax=Microbacterium esteraromaticum TaxID=57043 RepID=UPI001CD26F71|nr:hypothetical protein [Microbacterium esteraromaticum]MCA1306955.1 hypothetical protein [Microbacterium esteraromaticum]
MQDPTDVLTDPTQTEYIDDVIFPVLDETGVGPAKFELTGVTGRVTFYVACSPASEFRVDAFNNFFAGPCAPRFIAAGGIPVDPNTSTVTLTLPKDTEFHLIAVHDE